MLVVGQAGFGFEVSKQQQGTKYREPYQGPAEGFFRLGFHM